MRLQLALIFGEHLILQRGCRIPVFGTSANNDRILLELNGVKKETVAENGEWMAVFEPMEACEKTTLKVRSQLLDEEIVLNDVAIGEVWLAGGQSNMEFLMKYDVDAEKMKESPDDLQLRFFNYPQTPFPGFLEREVLGDHGFWRRWQSEENKIMFSAIGAYMGLILRQKLNVPIGIIGCNWGGTPASAWTALEDLKNNEKLKPVLAEYENNCSKIDFRRYLESAQLKLPLPSKEQLEFNDRFMMGEDMSEFFKKMADMPQPDISLWNAYPIAPLSATRPAGLYENMLKKVAPYAIRGVIWYQGEDDDARGWYDIYDESMITMIRSWRKLWGYDFPFFQMELAGFEGIGVTGAKEYALMRHQQRKAADALDEVYDVNITDAGERFNIHPRHKGIVGKRLAQMVLKHVYGFKDMIADMPYCLEAKRTAEKIELSFANAGNGLIAKGDLKTVLSVKDEEEDLDYQYAIAEDKLILTLSSEHKLKIEYCEMNYCVPVLYNSEDNPVFSFTLEV